MARGPSIGKSVDMQLTKKNHYNPCFWTAHWNTAFFEAALRGAANYNQVRNQKVFALSIKANKVFETSVENVHFDKGMGVAEITPDAAEDFCRRNFPAKYEGFREWIKDHPETLYLDFESILSDLEKTQAYTMLIDVLRKGWPDSPLKKGFLAAFVLIHELRGHALLNSMVEVHKEAGIPKFEYFWKLKHFIGNTNLLYACVMTFAAGYWTFYRLSKDTFPLNDSPILRRPRNIMVALSPRLLLEIDGTRTGDESQCTVANFISPEKLAEFRRRTIANTFREIIFGHRSLLEDWRQSEEFQERCKLMANVGSYNALVAQHENGQLWRINAYAGADCILSGE
ncbi:MAG: hypothetical protein L0Y72_22410 [Gemmataceae bacterium]|nr:hypothetical protein [Gemmataceae bacterium]MCI0741796.1 hypothetical protein [Gemmataceae bacterium]